MNKQTTKGNKMHIISETTRPNGVKVTIGNSFCADEMVAYTVKSSNSFDTRFYSSWSSAVDRFNELVKTANAEGKQQ